MTRKDYEVIARVFNNAMIGYMGYGRDAERACVVGLATRMADELLAASRFTPNGNKSFKVDVFLKACGVTA